MRTGEHFMLGFRGFELPDWLLAFEARFGLGGVLLFDRDMTRDGGPRNVASKDQVTALCAAVHALPSRPLVCVDQEGGLVRRLKPDHGFVDLPSAKALSALPELEARAALAASLGEMHDVGIDLDLAPVIDLDLNPANPNIGAVERSFSPDPLEVVRGARLWFEAARAVGLQLCLKHYPGLGSARTDSHAELTDVTDSLESREVDLFAQLASEVPGDAVLVSHAVHRGWDADWPASVSPAILRPLREARPDTLLVSDDLQMRGLPCPTAEAVTRALQAGIDFVCIGNNLDYEPEVCVAAAEAAAALVEHADTAERLAASRERIAQRKRAAAVGR
ncbi:MAG: glycoside hydrolase family 3 N-terminal domain-containing protein [Myxococcota bacterium]